MCGHTQEGILGTFLLPIGRCYLHAIAVRYGPDRAPIGAA
jgi:hypothetical protein